MKNNNVKMVIIMVIVLALCAGIALSLGDLFVSKSEQYGGVINRQMYVFENRVIAIYKKNNDMYVKFQDEEISETDVKLDLVETLDDVDFLDIDPDNNVFLLVINNRYRYLVSDNIREFTQLGNTRYLIGTNGHSHDVCLTNRNGIMGINTFTNIPSNDGIDLLVTLESNTNYVDYYDRSMRISTKYYGPVLGMIGKFILIQKEDKYYIVDVTTDREYLVPYSEPIFESHYQTGYLDTVSFTVKSSDEDKITAYTFDVNTGEFSLATNNFN